MVNEAPISPRKLVGFSRIFGKFFGDSQGYTPPKVEVLPISIRFLSKNLVSNKDGQISLSQTFEITRREDSQEIKGQIVDTFKILPDLAVLLEESSRGDSIPLSISSDDLGKISSGEKGTLQVKLQPGDKIKVSVLSEPYDHRWSTDLKFEVEAVIAK
jgi:hypothetical protein